MGGENDAARTTLGEWCDIWLKGYKTRRASTVRQTVLHDGLLDKSPCSRRTSPGAGQ